MTTFEKALTANPDVSGASGDAVGETPSNPANGLGVDGGTPWKQADDLSGIRWPLAGYAPGDYMGACRSCGTQMMGCDKRARQCLACAIAELREGYEEIDRAFRIKVWNEAKKAGLSDRAAMDETIRQRSLIINQVPTPPEAS